MALRRGANDFLHLEFVREIDWQGDRRRRPFPAPRPPVPEDRRIHGQRMADSTIRATEEIAEARVERGVDPYSLIVLEFETINLDLRETVEDRFHAWVVDEDKQTVEENGIRRDWYRFLVQFPDEGTFKAFDNELGLYRAQSPERGILTAVQRTQFFDGLREVRVPGRDDRLGGRLRREGWPAAANFFIDVDLWHPGSDDGVRVLESNLRLLCRNFSGELREVVRTKSLLLAKVFGPRAVAEALLDLDFVAKVDLPPRLSEAYVNIFRDPEPLDHGRLPDDEDPMLCVVDSGVIAGHPLLINWVIEERDFYSGEGTPVDQNGHGTAVAGLAVYGDVARCIETNEWIPRVRLCSAKVLRNDPDTGDAVFPEEHRVEAVIEEAIRYFVTERDCRVFNLSIGNRFEVYRGGRQFPLAEKLDELARDLDIVIVVSVGNRPDPPMPEALARDEFWRAVFAQLLSDPEQRVCSPATAALAVTVGALARSDALGHHEADQRPRLPNAFAACPANTCPPFTRVGPGYSIDRNRSAIKPDMVHYGGNLAVQTIVGEDTRWNDRHVYLGEPTIRPNVGDRLIGSVIGTSYATPHVSHAAAIAEVSLRQALGHPPSANLIRALVGSATTSPCCEEKWRLSEADALQVMGYGICDVETMAWSSNNRVRLVAEAAVEEDKLHVYRIQVPEEFLAARGNRGVTIALAYDPPTRSSRKEYLARTMWFELLHGLTNEQVQLFRAHHAGESPQMRPGTVVDLRPTKTKVMWSTLQVRRISWQRRPKLAEGTDEPVFHLLVGCQKRFATGLDPVQRYGLVVLFWHENERVELYQALRTRVRVPARVRLVEAQRA